MANLRLLEPETDLELFREAYNWRTPKRHLSAPQLPFSQFSETNPTHLTIGLFNGELLAVYFLQEWEPTKYEAHFTSRKGVAREDLLQGAQAVLDLVLTHGGTEVSALILPANRPLRQFVTDLGMKRVNFSLFTCVDDLEGCNFFTIQKRNQRKVYIKYVKMKDETPVGPFGQNPEIHTDGHEFNVRPRHS